MSKKELVKKARNIKVIATDVDGVLTDGFVFIKGDHEEPFGKFNIQDGLAISLAHKGGVKIVVISGRKSLATEARCQKLGIDLVYTGVTNKQVKLREVAAELGIACSEIAYIGDDLIDLPAMAIAGLNFAPANAVKDVKRRVDFVSQLSGGEGVLREVVEIVLNAQGSYDQILAEYLRID